jgi:hypothetical protein
MASSSGCSKRFAEVLITDDYKKMRYAKGTNYHTDFAKKLFLDFLSQKQYVIDPQSETLKNTLDNYIHDFLLSIRKDDGSQYSISGFDSIYFSISRYITDQYSVDIIHDNNFVKSKNARKIVRSILKKCGLGTVKHTDIICEDDLEKLDKFEASTPTILQLKVWFLLHYHLALRGNENSHDMKKSDLIISFENGIKYVELRDQLTKNHRGETTAKSNCAKMFATSLPNCPVECVENYLSKLNHENNFFWQRAKKKTDSTSSVWYDNTRVGINTLSTFMKKLSELAVLSKIYTNHTPRATCITILGTQFQDTDVASHSGHKSLSAMAAYKRTSESTKMKMSHALSSTMQNETYPAICDAHQINQPSSSAHCAVIPSSPCGSTHNLCCLSYGINDQPAQVDLDAVESEHIDLLQELDIEFDKNLKSYASQESGITRKEKMERSFINCTFHGCSINFN